MMRSMINNRGTVRVQSLKNQALIADKCLEAKSFFVRLRGLIGRKNFEPGEGMFFPRCNDIHMWFMSVPIDVVFLRRDGDAADRFVVTSVRTAAKPWRVLPFRDGRASETLELPVGTIQRCGIEAGDRVCIG